MSEQTNKPKQSDLWILRHQVLPNLYARKRTALADVLDVLESAGETPAPQAPQVGNERAQRIEAALIKLLREALVVYGFAQAWQPLSVGDIADLRRAADEATAALSLPTQEAQP